MKMNSNIDLKRKIQFNIEFQKFEIAYNNVFFRFVMNFLLLIESTTSERHIFVKIRLNICLKFYSSNSITLNVLLKFISSISFKKKLKRRMKSNIDSNI